jgi:PAS domain S-box-containing protein
MITPADVRRARVLIVDDQPVNVQLLEYLLKTTGYENVHSTTDPRQVVSLHLKHRFDLIILDLHMPHMDGFQVMEALKPLESESWLPVLVVTAEPDKKLAALEAGARDFIGKPLDTVEVMTRIRNLLEVRLMHRESREYGAHLERTVRERTAALERFRSAMDATTDGIFLVDAASLALVDVSDGACRMLGFSREALLRIDPVALGLTTAAQLERHLATNGAAHETDIVETELLRAGGEGAVPVEISWQWQEAGTSKLLIAVARDISERLQAQQRLKHLASFDGLTGLPNRTLFFQNLRERSSWRRTRPGAWRCCSSRSTASRSSTIRSAPALGDELLRQFSDRLVRVMRPARRRRPPGRRRVRRHPHHDARAAGRAAHVANEIRESLRAPFDLNGQQAVLTASIGIAMYPDDAVDPGTLVKYADTAMVRAKEAGRDGYRFFTAGMNVQVLARLDLEAGAAQRARRQPVRAALPAEARTQYGPRVRGRGAAALAPARPRPGVSGRIRAGAGRNRDGGAHRRLDHRRGLPPDRRVAGQGVRELRVAVNVSSRQFVEGDLEGVVRAALERHGIEPGLLELELTESALMTNAERTIEVLERLKALGIRIAIDDFGTGYSSLAYLKRFPIDKLKIDIAFVRDIVTNPDDAAIALAIISMAHSLHMQVIAEGSRRAPRWPTCGATAATRSRVSTFRARCRPPSWPSWCARTARRRPVRLGRQQRPDHPGGGRRRRYAQRAAPPVPAR